MKDHFHRVSGLSEIEHCVPGRKNPEQNDKRRCAQIFAHSCELAASTSDGHNFLARTPIRAFLDSTEIFLSLEFNKMKCSTKSWAGSWIAEELFVMISETSTFGTGLYLKCLRLHMASVGDCMLDVLYGIDKSWTFWTKSKLFPRPSMARFMVGNG